MRLCADFRLVCVCVCVSVCLSVCLSVRLSVCLSVGHCLRLQSGTKTSPKAPWYCIWLRLKFARPLSMRVRPSTMLPSLYFPIYNLQFCIFCNLAICNFCISAVCDLQFSYLCIFATCYFAIFLSQLAICQYLPFAMCQLDICYLPICILFNV